MSTPSMRFEDFPSQQNSRAIAVAHDASIYGAERSLATLLRAYEGSRST